MGYLERFSKQSKGRSLAQMVAETLELVYQVHAPFARYSRNDQFGGSRPWGIKNVCIHRPVSGFPIGNKFKGFERIALPQIELAELPSPYKAEIKVGDVHSSVCQRQISPV